MANSHSAIPQPRLLAVRALIADRRETFIRQGGVHATYRAVGGVRCGPYYVLRWRENGRRRVIYLGVSPQLAAAVAELLDELRRPMRHERQLDRLAAAARAQLRADKQQWRSDLAGFGLRAHGFEIRGWRTRVSEFRDIGRQTQPGAEHGSSPSNLIKAS